ncbi:uncharacterized protein V2V93DRAFT_374071 [Kockiozyma suomiensis]|uniref:uncharacterized protein n=1 Tax=Kockiozyma suomiensis TaxID=1337062 RepID=UPI00334372BD
MSRKPRKIFSGSTPASLLLNPASYSSPMADSLPTTVRRLSAAPPPPQDLLDAVSTSGRASFGADAIPLGDMLAVPGSEAVVNGSRPVFQATASTSVHAHGASFTSYYTGSVSTVSSSLTIGLSVSVVACIVGLTSLEHALRANPAHLAFGSCLVVALLLRFVVPSRLFLLSSSSSSSASSSTAMVGSRMQVSSVFADRRRSFRAIALGALQAVFIILYAFSATRQNMTSMHMNYFSVLPPLDLAMQFLLFRILPKTSMRTIAGTIINMTPQGLAFLSRDWAVGIEAVPIAVAQTLWTYTVFLEQAATESTAWLATIYVAFLVSLGMLLPISAAWLLYDYYIPARPESLIIPYGIVSMTAISAVNGVLLLTLFIASGYLIKWSSSAHTVALISSASTLLIVSWSNVLTPWLSLLGVILTGIAWAVYVR